MGRASVLSVMPNATPDNGRYLTSLLICISLIISGGQGEFHDSQCHAMVTGVISTWLVLGEECDLVVAFSHSVVSDSFPPRGL